MQDEEPLEFETLVEYLEQPEAVAHAQTRRRLLASAESRRRADLAARVQHTLREQPQCIVDESADDVSLTAELREQLQSLRAGRLDAESSARLRSRLQSDPRLLREALHASVAEAAIRAPAASDRHSPTEWVRRLLDWRVPAWAAAAAVLVLAVTLVAPFDRGERDGLRLAAYRDDATIRFAGKDTLPGVGFFAGAASDTRPFADVDLQLSGRELRMDWPDVVGARSYTVQLLVVESGKQREVAVREVDASEATLTLQPVTGQRYVWMISGTTDQHRFATRGGFVLQ